LSEFSEVYNEYEFLISRSSKIEATFSILTELQEWSQIVASVETALEHNQFNSARSSLVMANDIVWKMEKQAGIMALLSKMVKHKDLLTASVKNALSEQWDSMVFQYEGKDQATLRVSWDRQPSGSTARRR
jgi:hypothetical protein